MRELLAEAAEHDDRRARLAIDIFCYRVRKYIGAYLATLGLRGADGEPKPAFEVLAAEAHARGW